MPLKTDDLKNVDSYKKALKADGAKIGNGSKIKFWVYRDVELPTATGQKQKLPAFLALFDDTAVKSLLKGKTPACRGLCGLEEGKIAFEAAQGKVPYPVLIKSVPLLLGKRVHIPSDADAESDEDAPPSAPPAPGGSAPPPGRYAQLNAAWKQLAPQAEARIKANPGEQARLAPMLTDIPKTLQSGQLDEAQKRIEQLQAVLKTPPPPPPPAGPQAGANYVQLNNAWKQFSQQASQRMAANPAQRDMLTKAMAGIPEMLQGGQFAEARKKLQQLQEALKVAPAAPPRPPDGAAGARPAGTAGLVKYRAALLEFAQAKTKVQGQIQQLRGAILSQWPDEADFAKSVVSDLDEVNQELAAAINEAMKGAQNEASPVTDAIRMKIRKYQTELASNPLIRKFDTNPLGVTVTIGKTLGDALQRIRAAMPA